MIKKICFTFGLALSLYTINDLSGHCQMPCGIYHDNMVYDQIDQYVETMYKGVTIICNSKMAAPHDWNECVRWIGLKDKESNELAILLTTYFLQQKIKPGESDTPEKLASAHKLLFLLMQIKQTTDRKIVESFADEWEKFKLMFHVENYQCQVEMINQRKREQAKAAQDQKTVPEHTHDHDHDHDHTH